MPLDFPHSLFHPGAFSIGIEKDARVKGFSFRTFCLWHLIKWEIDN